METARILIVEDQPAFARGLKALLLAEAAEGEQEIQLSNNVESAMRAVEAFAPHLVLMDIRLPDGSGIDATAQIKEIAPTSVVVVLTAVEEEQEVLAALRAGASGYLLKTMDLHEIATAVESILHGNLVIPHHLASSILGSISTEDAGIALTSQEEQILAMIGKGSTNREIGGAIGISNTTVSKAISAIYAKLHIASRAQATAEAVRRGLT